jgi:uncharacterized membrane protein
MSDTTNQTDERLLAALAHAAIIASPIGIIVGLLLYLMHKEKSLFVAGQALQAAVYQLVAMFLTILVWSCWSVFYALTFIPLIVSPEQYQSAPPPIFWVGMGSMVLPFLGMGLLAVYGLYGALRVWRGENFQYLIIGKLITNRLTDWSVFDEL